MKHELILTRVLSPRYERWIIQHLRRIRLPAVLCSCSVFSGELFILVEISKIKKEDIVLNNFPSVLLMEEIELKEAKKVKGNNNTSAFSMVVPKNIQVTLSI